MRLALTVLLLASGVGGWIGWHLAAPSGLEEYDAALEGAARESGVDASLLRAMVLAESGGRATARSPRGARGLLQLVEATARQEAEALGIGLEGDDSLEDPATNLRLGASYLARLLRRYGGEEAFALAAYNAGPTNLGRWRARAPEAAPLEVVMREAFEETRAYVAKVLRLRERFAAGG